MNIAIQVLLQKEKPLSLKHKFDFEIKIDFNENSTKKGKKPRVQVSAEGPKKDEDFNCR